MMPQPFCVGFDVVPLLVNPLLDSQRRQRFVCSISREVLRSWETLVMVSLRKRALIQCMLFIYVFRAS